MLATKLLTQRFERHQYSFSLLTERVRALAFNCQDRARRGSVGTIDSLDGRLAIFCIVDLASDRRSTICPNVREDNDNGSARLGKRSAPHPSIFRETYLSVPRVAHRLLARARIAFSMVRCNDETCVASRPHERYVAPVLFISVRVYRLNGNFKPEDPLYAALRITLS